MFLPVSELNNGEVTGCVQFDTRMLCHSCFLLTTSESCYLFLKQIMWTHQGLLRLTHLFQSTYWDTPGVRTRLLTPSCSSSTSWLVLGPQMEIFVRAVVALFFFSQELARLNSCTLDATHALLFIGLITTETTSSVSTR